jgi:hypothetical protein
MTENLGMCVATGPAPVPVNQRVQTTSDIRARDLGHRHFRRILDGQVPRMPRPQYSPGQGRQTETGPVSHPRKRDGHLRAATSGSCTARSPRSTAS